MHRSQEPELIDDTLEEAISEDVIQIGNILAEALPAPRCDVETSNPFAVASFDPSLARSNANNSDLEALALG